MDEKYPRCDGSLYFTGFFAFCLWGHIPPEGGEKYESSLTRVIEPLSFEHDINDGRAHVKAQDLQNKKLRSDKSKMSSTESQGSLMVHWTAVFSKNRYDSLKISHYQSKDNSLVIQIDGIKERINDIREDMKMLNCGKLSKKDATELKKLKTQVTKLISDKNKLIQERIEISKEEEERTNNLANCEENTLYTTPSTSSGLKRDSDNISVLTDPVPKKICLEEE